MSTTLYIPLCVYCKLWGGPGFALATFGICKNGAEKRKLYTSANETLYWHNARHQPRQTVSSLSRLTLCITSSYICIFNKRKRWFVTKKMEYFRIFPDLLVWWVVVNQSFLDLILHRLTLIQYHGETWIFDVKLGWTWLFMSDSIKCVISEIKTRSQCCLNWKTHKPRNLI